MLVENRFRYLINQKLIHIGTSDHTPLQIEAIQLITGLFLRKTTYHAKDPNSVARITILIMRNQIPIKMRVKKKGAD
jgi:hypothetical protein